VRRVLIPLLVVAATFWSCAAKKASYGRAPDLMKIVDNSFYASAQQYKLLQEGLEKDRFPKTFEEGKRINSNARNWTSGFYPGTLIYLYEYTKDQALLNES
jgi:hypothetical protein